MAGHCTFPERIVEADILPAIAALATRHGLGETLLLVCDDATWAAAGQAVQQQLLPPCRAQAHSLGRVGRPLLAHSDAVREQARAMGATGLLAVGGGSVNDVAKYAAHRLGLPYISVATAASMNGYSSANASLERDGQKHSFAATAPRAVLADLQVLAAAPRRLARAGLGDTLCRSTVMADRFISHVMMGTPFERDLFARLQAHEPWLIANTHLLREGALPYMRALMLALLDAGDAMHEAGSSAVASQGEHMIAHTAELFYGPELQDILHGELVAVATVSMAQLQHKILLGMPHIRPLPREEDYFARLFGRQLAPRMAQAYGQKSLSAQQADDWNARFGREWEDIRREILGFVAPPAALDRALMQAGLATRARGLGLNEARYNAAVSYAYMTRERFTFLDISVMTAKRA